jgi:hypothetical protein
MNLSTVINSPLAYEILHSPELLHFIKKLASLCGEKEREREPRFIKTSSIALKSSHKYALIDIM